jgi:hypothetical protein
LFGHEDIFFHGLEFFRGVTEIAATRANHDIQVDGQLAANRRYQSSAGSDAAFKKIAAQLHPLRPAGLRGKRRLD